MELKVDRRKRPTDEELLELGRRVHAVVEGREGSFKIDTPDGKVYVTSIATTRR